MSCAGSQAKKRRLSASSTSANNEYGRSTIAERTLSRRASFSPESVAHALDKPRFLDNPESILRKNNAKCLASRLRPKADNILEGMLFLMMTILLFAGSILRNRRASIRCLHCGGMGLLNTLVVQFVQQWDIQNLFKLDYVSIGNQECWMFYYRDFLVLWGNPVCAACGASAFRG